MTTLYLVDDHAIVREGLRAVLEAAAFTVVGESDEPVAAFEQIVRLQPDVVLLDLSLGDRSGMELLAQLQPRALSTRVVVLTMSDQPRNIAEAIRLGAAGYVLKGSPGAEVVRAIHNVAQGRRHFSETVADRAIEALSSGQTTDPIARLSARERQILELVVRGQSSAAIGAVLHLSSKTVDTYRSRLMAKLGVRDLASLVRLAVREGIVDSEMR
jgi:two-component system, NarL family, invasion response regulator UvrY